MPDVCVVCGSEDVGGLNEIRNIKD